MKTTNYVIHLNTDTCTTEKGSIVEHLSSETFGHQTELHDIVPLNVANQVAIAVANNPVYHKRFKHMHKE